MSDDFAIHVVICTHGRADLLDRTLRSFETVTKPVGFEKLWVIENGSDSGARATCAQADCDYPIVYFNLPEQGKSRALQFALDKIGEGLVVFTDDDVRFDPDWLAAFHRAAQEHGHEAFYGGPLRVDYEDDVPPPKWMEPELPYSVRGWALDDPNATIDRAHFLGANYGGFVSAFMKVGGFRSHLGIGSEGNPVGEEFEIQDRMLAAGLKGVYVHDAFVWHWVPRERSTPRWTLERQERVWFTAALMGKKKQPGKTFFDVPRWMWRRLWVLKFKACAARFISNPENRFETQKLYYQWRGTIRGMRQRAKLIASGEIPSE